MCVLFLALIAPALLLVQVAYVALLESAGAPTPSMGRDHHEIADALAALWAGLRLQWLIDPRRDLVARMTAG
ncbi:hypothetical protein AB5J49_05535 [Streptomyces sp. R28]|uniref:Uncharacterized protein n=1 Tax=Streptomyces sp. R28 TaxID=3238628 RepID=A0AB39PUK8_9ACTN